MPGNVSGTNIMPYITKHTHTHTCFYKNLCIQMYGAYIPLEGTKTEK